MPAATWVVDLLTPRSGSACHNAISRIRSSSPALCARAEAIDGRAHRPAAVTPGRRRVFPDRLRRRNGRPGAVHTMTETHAPAGHGRASLWAAVPRLLRHSELSLPG